MVTAQDKSSKKMKFVSSADTETEPTSTTTISEDSKSGLGMSTMPRKLEYNHRLSRKGYAGLEDQLEETMPGVEFDRSTLWKKARQDKDGNIPDPKKSGDLENQDEEKNEEKKDEEKEEEKKFEEKKEEKKDEEKEKEKKFEEKKEEKKDEEKKEEKQDENEKEKKEDKEKHDDKVIEAVDYSNVEVPSSLQSLCRYAETTLTPQEKIMTFTIEKEVFGSDRSTFAVKHQFGKLCQAPQSSPAVSNAAIM
ncbi:unnamed protein product [Prunus brigantina]